jgi:hypothetical protein
VGLSGWTQRDSTKQCFFIPFPLLAGGSSDKMHDSKRRQSKITPQEQPHPDERISSEVSGSAVFRNRRPDLCSVGPKQGVPKVGRADETVLQRRGLPRWWLAVASSNPCCEPCLGTDPPVSLQGTTLQRASQVCEGLLASCLVRPNSALRPYPWLLSLLPPLSLPSPSLPLTSPARVCFRPIPPFPSHPSPSRRVQS